MSTIGSYQAQGRCSDSCNRGFAGGFCFREFAQVFKVYLHLLGGDIELSLSSFLHGMKLWLKFLFINPPNNLRHL